MAGNYRQGGAREHPGAGRRYVCALPSAATIPKLEPAPAADLAALRPAWEELARRSGNLFAAPDWLDLWWRHFGRGEPTVWTLDEGEDTVAVLPLYRHDGTLRFMGHGAGDELGPLPRAADQGGG